MQRRMSGGLSARLRALGLNSQANSEITPPADGNESGGDDPKGDDGNIVVTSTAPQPDAAEIASAVATAREEGIEEGATAANARVTTVFASEHAAGREQLAARMIQTAMTADEIVALLKDTPKQQAGNMLESLASQPNPDLGGGGATEPNTKAKVSSMWDRVQARNKR